MSPAAPEAAMREEGGGARSAGACDMTAGATAWEVKAEERRAPRRRARLPLYFSSSRGISSTRLHGRVR